MNSNLISRNEHLLRDVQNMLGAIDTATVPDELLPYAKRISELCVSLEQQINRNLSDLSRGRIDILEDVLSNTRLVNRAFKLVSYRMAIPILRSRPSDRLSLKVITWLHQEHASTKTYPAAVASDEVSMWPFIDICPIYFFPAIEQQTLLYQPLFFHEFGHLLYACHKHELDDLVFDLQRQVGLFLTPHSHRSDNYADRQRLHRDSIVGTWYNWAQELFCDAVGLLIGGPSFLRAFSMYMSRQSKSDFERDIRELRGSTHPVTWLRIRLLLSQARNRGLRATADEVEEDWGTIANILNVTEDYHGFYDESLDPAISQMIEDAIVEVAPRECLDYEIARCVTVPTAHDNPVTLLNRAWAAFSSKDFDYKTWEEDAIKSWFGSDNSVTVSIGGD